MPDRKLGIEVTATERVSAALDRVKAASGRVVDALRKVPDMAKRVGSTIGDAAKRGIAALGGLAQQVFFLREAFSTLVNIVKGLFNAFLAPAIQARKVELALGNLSGSAATASGMMDDMRRMSLATGASLQALYQNAPNVTSMFKDLQGSFQPQQWNDYLEALQRVMAYRPDLSTAEQIGIVNDMMTGNLEAAATALGQSKDRIEKALGVGEGGGAQQLGQYTSIVRGGDAVKKTASDVVKALDQLGIVSKNIDATASAMDRLIARWEIFKETVGAKILDKVAEALITLLDYLEQNEDAVMRLVDKFAAWFNEGIAKLIEWIDGGGIEALLAQFKDLWATLVEVWATLQPILEGIGRIGGGAIGRAIGGGENRPVGQGGFADAAAKAILRPKSSMESAWGTVGKAAGIGAGVVGAAIGMPFGKAKEWGSSAARGAEALGGQFYGGLLSPGMASVGSQTVQVVVSVEDDGALRAYTRNEIGRSNDQIAAGFVGGGTGRGSQPTFGGWGSK